MRESKPVQLEIFTPSASSDTGKRSNPFLEHLWGYEKTILILIAVVAVGVLSFALGVEKGKKMAMREAVLNNAAPKVSPKAAAPTVQPVQRIDIQSAQVAVNNAPRPSAPVAVASAAPRQTVAQAAVQPAAQQPVNFSGQTGNFTIQIASYKNKQAIDKQAQALKKKGVTVIILTKGDYLVLCIGRFPSQDDARVALQEVQKQYKGCLIRRL